MTKGLVSFSIYPARREESDFLKIAKDFGVAVGKKALPSNLKMLNVNAVYTGQTTDNNYEDLVRFLDKKCPITEVGEPVPV